MRLWPDSIAERVAVIAELSAISYGIYVWITTHIEKYHQMETFITELRTNHLPHIEKYLKKLCDRQGIQYEDWGEHGSDSVGYTRADREDQVTK